LLSFRNDILLWLQDYENFVSYICKAYKGTAVLEGCSSVSLNTIQKGKAKPIQPDCYENGMLAFAARITSAITSWMDRINMVASV
jgi:interferon gamma-inducible protein 30